MATPDGTRPASAVLVPPALQDAFHTDGYVVARGVLSAATVGRVREFVEAAAHGAAEVFRARLGVDASDSDALGRLIADETGGPDAIRFLPQDIRSLVRGELPLAVRLDPMLRLVAREERLVALIASLLGTDAVALHLPPMARAIAPGQRHALVPPHQDWSYNRHLARPLTVWVPLVPIDDTCAGVRFWSGSHRAGRLAHGKEGLWGESVGSPPALAQYPIDEPHLGPGDALLFGPLVVHASLPNRAAHTRLSLDYRFFPRADGSTKHHLDLATERIVVPDDPAGPAAHGEPS